MSDIDETVLDLIRDVHVLTHRLSESPTLGQQATTLIDLQSTVDQLVTWHPEYDYKLGEVVE